MQITEKFFALGRVAPFNGLRHDELTLVAEVARHRRFIPGEVLLPSGTPVARLYIVVQGSVVDADHKPLPAVFGATSLLYNYPLGQDVLASRDVGAACLMIGKGHFFTLINECPEFTAGLIELSRLEASFYVTTA